MTILRGLRAIHRAESNAMTMVRPLAPNRVHDGATLLESCECLSRAGSRPGVDGRVLDLPMTQVFFHELEGFACIEKMRGNGVPQAVAGGACWKRCALRVATNSS